MTSTKKQGRPKGFTLLGCKNRPNFQRMCDSMAEDFFHFIQGTGTKKQGRPKGFTLLRYKNQPNFQRMCDFMAEDFFQFIQPLTIGN